MDAFTIVSLLAMATPVRFSMSYTVMAGGTGTQTSPGPMASDVEQLIDEHHPREMVDNMALVIIDQTYVALLEILGTDAPPPDDVDGNVQVTRPVDPAEPDSPLLCANASPAHCCIRLIDGSNAVGGEHWNGAPSRSTLQYRLSRSVISVSPGALHVARRADGDGGGECWTCADDVRPDVSAKGVLAILDAIGSRLDAAIRLEATLLRMARASGCKSLKLYEINEVHAALKRMRAEVDVSAIMRRRESHRHVVQDMSCCRTTDNDMSCDAAEELATRLNELCVGQKRCRPAAAEMGADPVVDDAEALAKRLKAMHV